ncbi:MAG: ABC transporter substrate-binding protein [Lachnospiraceae bacterium]|nr:ABC transporter substrate-binding protein [Lachnospiraceae bacterium]
MSTDERDAQSASNQSAPENALIWADMKPDRSMELVYADQFSVDYYGEACELVTIEGTGQYLVIEEGYDVPSGLPDDVTVIRKPLTNVYLAASSAMDFMDALETIPCVTMTSTKSEDWSIASAAEALDSGDMVYVGKYSAPDYEALRMEECSLAIESTMIYHTPEVKEKIESLGIPVMVEHSSYESHPIGRTEWIRLYGLLFDREDEAERFFDEQRKLAEDVIKESSGAQGGKTVGFFYITSAGLANVRKSGDYVARMICLAGGTYVPELPGMESENALSTMNMQMEDFYAGCVDADILIYNSSIDGEIGTVDDLLQKSPLFADFKALKSCNVWCAEQDMFQHTTSSAEMIREIRLVITGEAGDDLKYLHRVGT